MIRVYLQKLADAGPRMWGLLLAGPAVTAIVIYFAQAVRAPVPVFLMGKQLDFLGWALLLAIALLGIVVTALAAARVSMRGPGGLDFNADASEGDHGNR